MMAPPLLPITIALSNPIVLMMEADHREPVGQLSCQHFYSIEDKLLKYVPYTYKIYLAFQKDQLKCNTVMPRNPNIIAPDAGFVT